MLRKKHRYVILRVISELNVFLIPFHAFMWNLPQTSPLPEVSGISHKVN